MCYFYEVEFAWDQRKAAGNVQKHGIAFDEAVTVFGDPLALVVEDVSYGDRTIIIGESTRSRLLLVVYAEPDEGTTRIISARRATAHERRRYEEGT
jgi:uncharacterized DUF497 family protein